MCAKNIMFAILAHVLTRWMAIWNLCLYENYFYMKIGANDSKITFVEILFQLVLFIEKQKIKSILMFWHYFISNLVLMLIIIAINCYYIKHQLKQKTY